MSMVRENDFEKNLHNFYAEKRFHPIEKRQDCPTQLELMDYLEKRLSLSKREQIIDHISGCQGCLSMVELAQRAENEPPVFSASPARMVTRAKKLALPVSCRRGSQYKWLILAVVPFALSFIFPRYFLQFLIAAVILGLKWVFDTAASRTLIMVYDAWRSKDKDSLPKEREIFHHS
ncbi:MAG: hypothetical protein V1662_05390 [Candidatus Omnitrophota bacterium]